jgi:capsular exopolysaccharide synthesis family protein
MSLLSEALRRAAQERDERTSAWAASWPASLAMPGGVAPLDGSAGILSRGAVHRLVVAHTAARTTEAQQYTNLRTQVLLALGETGARAVVVTSAVPKEGKSVTAVNFAACLAANADGRTIIVDADLRTPTVHALLGVPRKPGVSELLRGHVALEAAMHLSVIDRLAVLPAGEAARSPSHLLTSAGFRGLLASLRTRFDDIVIDVGPILALADARALASLSDGVVLVVRAGYTPREDVLEAVRRLQGARLLGVVLNRAVYSEMEPYYHYGHSAEEER